MTILTFKPYNQQSTSAIHNYLRDNDYTELEFNRPIIKALYSYRFYHIEFMLVVDTYRKEFNWQHDRAAMEVHPDYKCATITRLVRFVNPHEWEVVTNAMDIMEQYFSANKKLLDKYYDEDWSLIVGTPNTIGNFYAKSTRLRGRAANEIIVDYLS